MEENKHISVPLTDRLYGWDNIIPERTFFTSDLHLGHKNIIKYENRPYDTLDEMNMSLLENINSVVGEDDLLFIVGDISFLTVAKTEALIKLINCKNIVILQGNHDQNRLINRLAFKHSDVFSAFRHNERAYFEYGDVIYILGHIPIVDVPDGCVNIHGHLHTNGFRAVSEPCRYDAGVDNNGMVPVSLKTIIKTINNNKNNKQ